jgi:ABC-type siderophore export system fused ATPase/permease subunit
MTTHKNFIPVLLVSLLLGVVVPASAQSSAAPAVTLDQAVLKVQQETSGKVLSAKQRGIGRRQEYRIKVLTPDGHVREMVVSSEASKNPVSTPSTKNPPGKNPGSKEKH